MFFVSLMSNSASSECSFNLGILLSLDVDVYVKTTACHFAHGNNITCTPGDSIIFYIFNLAAFSNRCIFIAKFDYFCVRNASKST